MFCCTLQLLGSLSQVHKSWQHSLTNHVQKQSLQITIFENHMPSLVSIAISISILGVVLYHILLNIYVIWISSSLQILLSKRKRKKRKRTMIHTIELYYDAFQEERDPLVPVYSCAECHYVAEIKCVIFEVSFYSHLIIFGDMKVKTIINFTSSR